MSDFPVILNDRVRAALKYLQTHRSDDIAQAFLRARRYAGMMRAIFREHNLPEELVNLAFVYSPESKISGANQSQGIVAYETKMSQTAFELGATYRF